MREAEEELEPGGGKGLKGWELNINSELEQITTQDIELGGIGRSKDQSNQYYELRKDEKHPKKKSPVALAPDSALSQGYRITIHPPCV